MIVENLSSFQVIISLSITLLVIYIIKTYPKKQYKLPPGPRAWPIIGNIPDIYSAPSNYKTLLLKWSKIYGNIIMFKRFGMKFVYINDYNVAYKALVHDHPFDLSGRPTIGTDRLSVGDQDIFFTMSMNKEYQQIRKLIISSLASSAEKVKMTELCYEFFPMIKDHVKHLQNNKITTLEYFCYWISHNLLIKVFYRDFSTYHSEDFQEFIIYFDKISEIIEKMGPFDFSPLISLPFPGKKKVLEIGRFLANLIIKYVKYRKESNAYEEDPRYFIDYMLKYQKEQSENPEKYVHIRELTDEYIGYLVLDIYYGGLDAFGLQFTWILGLLASYPKYQNKIRQEYTDHLVDGRVPMNSMNKLHNTNAFIYETLRFNSLSAFTSLHRAQSDLTIGQYDIPKETIVAVNLHGIHFDPKYWKDPDQFLPERFLNANNEFFIPKEGFVAFGLGKRSCIAQRHMVKEAHNILTGEFCRNYEISWSSKNQSDCIVDSKKNVFFRHPEKFCLDFKLLID